MYSWADVAKRTEHVYHQVIHAPDLTLNQRFNKYHGCGVFAGKIAIMVMAVDYLLYLFLEWLFPRDDIDTAPSFDMELFHEHCKKKIK